MTEIDDIFASKKRISSSTSAPAAVKRKRGKTAAKPDCGSTKQGGHEPPTIIDPSIKLPNSDKSTRTRKQPDDGKAVKRKQPDDAFADSRGTASRRKTEEGWMVYKEDELGITDKGGDTPLCPFDCDCCF